MHIFTLGTRTISPACELLIEAQIIFSAAALWLFVSTDLCFWLTSTGAGAAVWEGAPLAGGAEDASQATAGGAEGGADLQTRCSHWGGRASDFKCAPYLDLLCISVRRVKSLTNWTITKSCKPRGENQNWKSFFTSATKWQDCFVNW